MYVHKQPVNYPIPQDGPVALIGDQPVDYDLKPLSRHKKHPLRKIILFWGTVTIWVVGSGLVLKFLF